MSLYANQSKLSCTHVHSAWSTKRQNFRVKEKNTHTRGRVHKRNFEENGEPETLTGEKLEAKKRREAQSNRYFRA